MMTTIIVATVTALISNKLMTGQFTKPKKAAPIGTTIYTRLLEKKTTVMTKQAVDRDEKTETSRDEKTSL